MSLSFWLRYQFHPEINRPDGRHDKLVLKQWPNNFHRRTVRETDIAFLADEQVVCLGRVPGLSASKSKTNDPAY